MLTSHDVLVILVGVAIIVVQLICYFSTDSAIRNEFKLLRLENAALKSADGQSSEEAEAHGDSSEDSEVPAFLRRQAD